MNGITKIILLASVTIGAVALGYILTMEDAEASCWWFCEKKEKRGMYYRIGILHPCNANGNGGKCTTWGEGGPYKIEIGEEFNLSMLTKKHHNWVRPILEISTREVIPHHATSHGVVSVIDVSYGGQNLLASTSDQWSHPYSAFNPIVERQLERTSDLVTVPIGTKIEGLIELDKMH